MSWMSTYVEVEISPDTTTRPVFTSVSQATRPVGSSRMTASRTPSEIWSATLSGWPSVTDSDVNRNSLSEKLVILGSSPAPGRRRFQRRTHSCQGIPATVLAPPATERLLGVGVPVGGPVGGRVEVVRERVELVDGRVRARGGVTALWPAAPLVALDEVDHQ